MACSISAIALISLIFTATFTNACNTCTPTYPHPTETPPLIPPTNVFCPLNILKLGMCGDLLSSLLNLVGGEAKPYSKCCTLLGGLDDAGAALCICEALKANVLGVHLDWAVSIKLLINTCGKSVPSSFSCV